MAELETEVSQDETKKIYKDLVKYSISDSFQTIIENGNKTAGKDEQKTHFSSNSTCAYRGNVFQRRYSFDPTTKSRSAPSDRVPDFGS